MDRVEGIMVFSFLHTFVTESLSFIVSFIRAQETCCLINKVNTLEQTVVSGFAHLLFLTEHLIWKRSQGIGQKAVVLRYPEHNPMKLHENPTGRNNEDDELIK